MNITNELLEIHQKHLSGDFVLLEMLQNLANKAGLSLDEIKRRYEDFKEMTNRNWSKD